MQTVLVAAAALFLAIHGLIHLLGTAAYMKLVEIEGLPYKTTLLGGRWELGERGIRVFGALWIVPAVGFVLAALALGLGWAWWQPLVVVAALLSLVLTALDWSEAYAGIAVNVIILALVWLGPTVLARFS